MTSAAIATATRGEPLICARLREHGLGYVTDDHDSLGIKARVYEGDGLVVLNYCQINSPKMDPVTQQCRGLILALDDFRVVSRSFDRFFNLGEATCADFELQPGDVIQEKADGSLVKLYHWRGDWHVSSRGTAFGEADMHGGRPFAEIVRDAVPILLDWAHGISPNFTHVFELVSPENRVVKVYEKPGLIYLGSRRNDDGRYHDFLGGSGLYDLGLGIRPPRTYGFGTAAECAEAAKSLPDMEEGYVVRRGHVPVCKIKSPAYVAAHRLFSEPLTTKRIVELILTGEASEFVAYFPDLAHKIEACDVAIKSALAEMDRRFLTEWNVGAETQKDFALRVAHLPYSALLFQARGKSTLPSEAFGKVRDSVRTQIAMDAVDPTPTGGTP